MTNATQFLTQQRTDALCNFYEVVLYVHLQPDERRALAALAKLRRL